MSTLPINTDESPAFVTELIYRLKIKDAMTTTLFSAGPEDSLRSLQLIMKEQQITGLPVVDGKRILGIVSMDDVIRALDEGYIEEPAGKHMTRQIIVLEDDMPLSFGLSYLEKYRFGRFPVLSKEKNLVGIITSRDILTKLLMEVNKEVERRERLQTTVQTPGSFYREYRVRQFDFEHSGKPTGEIKIELKQKGLDPKFVRRVSVASYELEMNQVVHSVGGTLKAQVTPKEIVIEAIDTGPGIPDVDQALTEGYSTATEWVRSLGFGAGMGLPNARRAADDFEITSSKEGTRVRCIFHIPGASDESQ
jgi:CBS domain-containing protein